MERPGNFWTLDTGLNWLCSHPNRLIFKRVTMVALAHLAVLETPSGQHCWTWRSGSDHWLGNSREPAPPSSSERQLLPAAGNEHHGHRDYQRSLGHFQGWLQSQRPVLRLDHHLGGEGEGEEEGGGEWIAWEEDYGLFGCTVLGGDVTRIS